jgi:hypothetical protein
MVFRDAATPTACTNDCTIPPWPPPYRPRAGCCGEACRLRWPTDNATVVRYALYSYSAQAYYTSGTCLPHRVLCTTSTDTDAACTFTTLTVLATTMTSGDIGRCTPRGTRISGPGIMAIGSPCRAVMATAQGHRPTGTASERGHNLCSLGSSVR